MPYITTKALTAPKSTSLAVGTFYFRVPYDRDAVDRTLVTFPDRLRIGTDGKIPPTLFTPGPYTVVREIKGGAGGLSPQPFVVPENPPASSSSPGAVQVTVNGSAVLAWDIYYLTDQNVTYPQPVVGAAQAARDIAVTKAAEAVAARDAAAATAASLASITAGAPEDFNTFAEVAAGKLSKAEAATTYAPQSGAGSPSAALTSANSHADDGDASTLTTATGRAVAFSIIGLGA